MPTSKVQTTDESETLKLFPQLKTLKWFYYNTGFHCCVQLKAANLLVRKTRDLYISSEIYGAFFTLGKGQTQEQIESLNSYAAKCTHEHLLSITCGQLAQQGFHLNTSSHPDFTTFFLTCLPGMSRNSNSNTSKVPEFHSPFEILPGHTLWLSFRPLKHCDH